jgi:hypothetical protein
MGFLPEQGAQVSVGGGSYAGENVSILCYLTLLFTLYSNGRLAMLAISGMWTQDAMFGNYGDMIFKN